ncbi:MAG: hypothetical protein MUF49_00365 [Oculatellaceae cyanobacterium Prado106]|nr:hypothetical protein [Oculatellaceae cyanobacterium Prado106]
MITLLGIPKFEQHVFNMALVHLCDREGYVGGLMRGSINESTTDEPTVDPWTALQQITLYIPHPEQQYDGLSLEAGLTQGYNLEVQPGDRSRIPYLVPKGAQFVRVLRQKGIDAGFGLAAIGLFIRPLALLKLDWIVDAEQAEYQTLAVRHPVIRDYPSDWEQKLQLYLQQEIPVEALPDLAGYVDRTLNSEYNPPNWTQISAER